MTVLLVDADSARGARAVADLVACGFPAAAVSPGAARTGAGSRRAHLLAIARSSAAGSSLLAADAPLTADEIAGLRRTIEASRVLLWDASVDGVDAGGSAPAWADGIATGMAALIGEIALHALAAGAPIGELAQARRRLDEARRAAHDLTQPLTTILARAKLLLESVKEEDPSHRPIAIIARESERLSKSVDRIREALPPRRRA
ncbi:MAG: hypothetical protein HY049_11070 [Acidobacteria bacterium]|nr:hypothetical protein [Acidobacteriota bacterium]